MKVYRGSAGAARSYVEADRSRADDYYLGEGTGLADRLVAVSSDATVNDQSPSSMSDRGDPSSPDAMRAGVRVGVRGGGTLDGDAYEAWVAGYDTVGVAKGRLRTGDRGVRFVEVTVNGPKTWSLAAAVHPDIAAAYDVAQDRAAREIVGWLVEHATTRVGPLGRQVQVAVEELEAVVVRHQTSRAGDPHRHLHLQINARVWAEGKWRGIHTVGVRDSLAAINGIGHAAVACDPEFRRVLAMYGYHLDPNTAEITELAPYAGAFSARAAQISRNVDRFETQWRAEHPGEEPGPRLRRAWDTRAWAQARPDKVVPSDGEQLRRAWVGELEDLGFTPPTVGAHLDVGKPGELNRDLAVDVALTRLGAARSAWNPADIRGEVEQILTQADIVTAPAVRKELAEDLVARTVGACVRLLDRPDVPEHVRALTSARVVAVEADLVARLTDRTRLGRRPAQTEVHPTPAIPAGISRLWLGESTRGMGSAVGQLIDGLDDTQADVVTALAGMADLVVVEGAAGAGKTTTLAAADVVLRRQGHRLVVVTPTRKAAGVVTDQLAIPATSAAWLAHHHGFRWDADGHRERIPTDPASAGQGREPREKPVLTYGDVLLVDEAGMLDQDTALALLSIADETGARVVLMGDRHQLPAVGRGGVLDLAARWAPPEVCLTLDAVHRFTDPDYATLTLQMRTGQHPEAVFDQLVARGDIVIHPTDQARNQTLTNPLTSPTGDLVDTDGNARVSVVADTRERVAALNAGIRDQRVAAGLVSDRDAVTTKAGERIGVGDRVVTRRNDPGLDVANRDAWIVTAIGPDGDLTVARAGGQRSGERSGERILPAGYVADRVELGYATTVYGAQGDTVDTAHFLLGDHTGAASAYVAMTRGRHSNTAHLVAETVDDARNQWVAVFSRDRADLGPAHAAGQAAADIDRYGPAHTPHLPRRINQSHVSSQRRPRRPEPDPVTSTHRPNQGPGIGR